MKTGVQVKQHDMETKRQHGDRWQDDMEAGMQERRHEDRCRGNLTGDDIWRQVCRKDDRRQELGRHNYCGIWLKGNERKQASWSE